MKIGQFIYSGAGAKNNPATAIGTSADYAYLDTEYTNLKYRNPILNMINLNTSDCYCLKFTIPTLTANKGKDDEKIATQDIKVVLKFQIDEFDDTYKYQTLKSFVVQDIPNTYMVIFKPKMQFNQIAFNMVHTREYDDITTTYNGNKCIGLTPVIQNPKLYKLTNLVTSQIQAQEGDNEDYVITELGIRTSNLVPLCINGEEIHTWYNGIYELHDVVDIDYLSFFIDEDIANETVIIDYCYKKAEDEEEEE